MSKIIIGLIGETGSGKDTFCDRIKKTVKKPVFCFRFSDPLSEVLKIFFDEVKKEDQQWLAGNLRERFGENILGEAIKKKVNGMKKGIIILNGVRMPQEVKMIKEIGGKIIYITADSRTRWERVTKRGEKKDDSVSYEKFLEMEKAKSEVNIPDLGREADFRIENNGSVDNLYKKIDMLIKNIKL